jgi:hypothetical protein
MQQREQVERMAEFGDGDEIVTMWGRLLLGGNFEVNFGERLHEKDAVERRIWALTKHLRAEKNEPCKTLYELIVQPVLTSQRTSTINPLTPNDL